MVTLRLYLENVAGDWFGWIEDFPGAYAQGATKQEAEESAARDFLQYVIWLALHGEPVPEVLRSKTTADFGIDVARVHAEPVDSVVALRHTVPGDSAPLGHSEFERLLRLLRCARTDLSEAVHSIPPHEWDTAPLGEPSVRGMLQNLLQSEMAMLAKAGLEPTLRPHPDPWITLLRGRDAFEAAVQDAFERDFRDSRLTAGDLWPLAKVLRLTLWNERHGSRRIAVRSNPAAYLRSVSRGEAVVQRREHSVQPTQAVTAGDEVASARHTQNSGYYY